MNQIIPTVFAHNKKEFSLRFQKLLPVSKHIQIDFMDGKFVPEKSVLLYQIPDLQSYKNIFEAHLMVKNPIRDIKTLKRKGFSKVVFHYESYGKEKMINKTIFSIKKLNMEAWLAVNPETDIASIVQYLNSVDGVLFMGVVPGKEHQSFISRVYEKIKSLKDLSPKTKIQVDGGANEETIPKLAKIGVNYINSGSYISDSENPEHAYKKLKESWRGQ